MGDLNLSDAVKLYVENRERLSEMKKDYEARALVITQQQELLETYFLQQMQELGLKNIPTEFGTPYTSVLQKFSIKDRTAFLDWVKKSDAFDVFTNSVNKTAVTAYMEANNGELPPGLAVAQVVNVNVRT